MRLRDALCRCRPGPRAAPSAVRGRGREAETVQAFAANLRAHAGKPTQIAAISIDMSPAFIKGVEANFPNAQITFDVPRDRSAPRLRSTLRRAEQKPHPSLKGCVDAAEGLHGWGGRSAPSLDALLANMTSSRTCPRLGSTRAAARDHEPQAAQHRARCSSSGVRT
ncbi:MAG: transposase [Steroidobacteraceae bacterium]